MTHPLTLQTLPGRYAVCRLAANAPIPPGVLSEPFFFLVRTADELSFTIPEERVAPGWQAERGWRVLMVRGPLDFGMIGVLASIATPLAEAGISIFVTSTYDTDYVMVKEVHLAGATAALRRAGMEVTADA